MTDYKSADYKPADGKSADCKDLNGADMRLLTESIARTVKEAVSRCRMTLDTAKTLIAQGEKAAEAIGVPMVISVVDEGGNLTALHRMDGSLLASLSVSQSKAFTALALRAPTGEAAKTILPGQPLYGLQNTHPGQFCLFGGGFPLMSGGCCIGAVGVSGGTVEQDTAVGESIVRWFEENN